MVFMLIWIEKPQITWLKTKYSLKKYVQNFFNLKRRYGTKRIKKCLFHENICVSHRRITRLMRKNELIAKGCRYHYKRYNTTNLINQVFKTKAQARIEILSYVNNYYNKENAYSTGLFNSKWVWFEAFLMLLIFISEKLFALV